MADRTILHCDMNSFYASVELLDHPECRGLPTAVCGDPKNRHGIILAKSEEAKAFGIKTAMTVREAKALCPNLRLLAPHHDKYSRYSKVINAIYQRYTDMVEPFSVDESWLDVTASRRLFGDGKTIADDIRRTVWEETGLTLSAGVSFNKIFAKMGSEYKKPNATTVISRENYKEILWPLAVDEMFFVGRATAEKLHGFNIRTIGDLATADRAMLESHLGKMGGMLHDYANGTDDAPVSLSYEKQKIKSIGNGITFRRDLLGADDIHTALAALCDNVSARLRRHALKAYGVKVDIKDPSMKSISRQKALPAPANTAEFLAKGAFSLIEEAGFVQRPIRLLTVTGIQLVDEDQATEQLDLFGLLSGSAANDAPPEETATSARADRQEDLSRAMDTIRDKYGKGAISYARLLDNDLGIHLEDIRLETK